MTRKKTVFLGLGIVGGALGACAAVKDSVAAVGGAVFGCAAAVVGLTWWFGKKSRGRRTVRVDELPEPLTVGKVLYEAEGEDPVLDWTQFERYQNPNDLSVADGCMVFRNPVRSDDEWDYVYLDPVRYSFRDCAWTVKFRRNTTFREYAFNFRYQDFDNRYRYRFEDDKIFFDKKVAGVWTNNIASCPFAMMIGEWYDLRIDVAKSLCRCYVNGELRMENTDTDLDWGSICIILWEDDGETPIAAEIGASQVRELILENGGAGLSFGREKL